MACYAGQVSCACFVLGKSSLGVGGPDFSLSSCGGCKRAAHTEDVGWWAWPMRRAATGYTAYGLISLFIFNKRPNKGHPCFDSLPFEKSFLFHECTRCLFLRNAVVPDCRNEQWRIVHVSFCWMVFSYLIMSNLFIQLLWRNAPSSMLLGNMWLIFLYCVAEWTRYEKMVFRGTAKVWVCVKWSCNSRRCTDRHKEVSVLHRQSHMSIIIIKGSLDWYLHM